MLNGFENKGEMKKEDKQNTTRVVMPRFVQTSSDRNATPDLPDLVRHRGMVNGARLLFSVSPSSKRISPINRVSESTAEAASYSESQVQADEEIETLVKKGNFEGIKTFFLKMVAKERKKYFQKEKFGNAGDSLLHIAVKYNQSESLRSLRKLGADLAVYNYQKQNPVHYSAKYSVDARVIEELFKFKNALSLFDEEDMFGKTGHEYVKGSRREPIFANIFDDVFYPRETAILIKGVKEAKKEYKEKEKEKQKEQIENLGGYVSAYVLGRI